MWSIFRATRAPHAAASAVRNPRVLRKAFWTAAASAALAALVPLQAAYAHVTVAPSSVPADSFQTLAVRVPTERDEPTVKVRVEFPAGLTVSRFQPKPGWTREVEQDSQKRITAVTWSGGKIMPGEFDEFILMARTPKEPGKLAFKAYQTYQSGETVAWVEGEGQQHPAALVTVTNAPAGAAAGDEHDAAAVSVQPSPAPQMAASSAAPAASQGSDLPLLASVAALVLSLLALVLAGVGLARRPRPA